MREQTKMKIEKIQSQIDELKKKQEKLHEKMEIKILKLLRDEKIWELDFEIVYGALVDVISGLKDVSDVGVGRRQLWKEKGADLLNKKKKAKEKGLS